MSTGAEALVGLAIAVGLVGIVIPILPGTILIFAAILVWAIISGTATAWAVFAVATLFLVVSGVVKYTWPGQRMRSAGVPNMSLVVGGLTGIVGFFVIPVVGLFLGFIAGTYVAELYRLRVHNRAWASTWHACKAVGLSMLIELLGALIASGVWLAAVVAT
ncbi:DUF456 domain-containing protein [Rhodococcus tibetensis]|uniref:DUF456 domain-containing protein n=1 Tax=Rhodococcus tibetensis TaxID=2965064 RepID=A0ABT1Q745_9NOCA|nr:DUF456 domain-containing protein [Rhodococcus sp. FXJ9.536]MCQ4118073.1 DUF456 domain-containing protein [Rhodococcus sp. FXJ9.536]